MARKCVLVNRVSRNFILLDSWILYSGIESKLQLSLLYTFECWPVLFTCWQDLWSLVSAHNIPATKSLALHANNRQYMELTSWKTPSLSWKPCASLTLIYISKFILRNASRLFSLVLLELQVDNCIHLHRELLSSAARYASYRWLDSSTRVACKAGPKCPAIPWYQQESIQISTVDEQLTTDHYMQQRQKGYHYRKLSQVISR